MRKGWSVHPWLVGVLLGILLVTPLHAQPFSAQIQRALNAFVAAAHSWTGTQTFTNITVGGTCTGCGGGSQTPIITTILDTNSNEQIKFTTTASAVNELTLANAATGGDPTWTASGDDSNVWVKFAGKGTGTFYGNLETIAIAVSDETTALTTGTAKVTFHMPYNFSLLKVKAGVTTVSSSGLPTFDLKDDGVSVFSTKVTIDANETFSDTAATPSVLTSTPLAIASGSVMTINIDVAGTGTAGAKIYLIGYATGHP